MGESGELIKWTGRATFLTVTGRILIGPLNVACQWFCTFDIDYRGSFPDASPSWSRLKTLYDNP